MLNSNQENALFHLGYEWWMFRAAHDLLQTLPQGDDPVRNALVESLAIHGRVLTNFFHQGKKRKSDWSVADLQHGLTVIKRPQELADWQEETSKRVAHLTNRRQSPLDAWDASKARFLLDQGIKRVKEALAQEMPKDWIGDNPTTSKLICRVGIPGITGLAPAPMGATGPIGVTGPAKA